MAFMFRAGWRSSSFISKYVIDGFLAIICLTSTLVTPDPVLIFAIWRATSVLNMPDNSSDSVGTHVNDPFTALLVFLCPDDPDEANRRYLRLHLKLEGYFRLRGMSDPVNDADETFERASKKIVAGVGIPDIDKFCMGIARNIVLERIRERKREESAFVRFLENSHDNSTEILVDRIMNLMKPCFERLPPEDQDLLHSYCKVPAGHSQAEHRRKLAESLRSTIAALRIKVTRLRRSLEECVKALSKKR
jgi:DNA-directed RNA polymerase specialized sigma24 family protein